GYLLDQIRINGEKTELVEEVTALAKRYGIATPYTSYLIVPDGEVPVVNGGGGRPVPRPALPPAVLRGAEDKPGRVIDFLQKGEAKDDFGKARNKVANEELERAAADSAAPGAAPAAEAALEKKKSLEQALAALKQQDGRRVQSGKLGVDLSVANARLRDQRRLEQTAQRRVAGRTCIEIGGLWVDTDFNAKMDVVVVKAMSDGYFKLLAKRPELKELFRLGNYLVWVAPSGQALVIDAGDGKEQLTDAEIDALFTTKK
ncbi:MAG: hypothetical protein AB7K24_27140, partial [Gemmataceae bacterium]